MLESVALDTVSKSKQKVDASQFNYQIIHYYKCQNTVFCKLDTILFCE